MISNADYIQFRRDTTVFSFPASTLVIVYIGSYVLNGILSLDLHNLTDILTLDIMPNSLNGVIQPIILDS